jgi:GT2 family glycosyltransferase
MSQPRVSVIVVSHGRPDLSCRAALSVFHQNHRPVELITVADHVGLAAISTLSFVSRIKRVLFENENISAARNIGIDHAAAEYIAFLDDDAVAEPMWLSLMLNEMCQHPRAALTGTVLGRNGISVQWGDVGFDELGRDQPKSGSGPRKLHGTNMLFRADILRQIGGFDEAYRFLYDDTDLAMRLHHAGHETGYLDGGLIHHGFAQSVRRSARRAPKTLFEIGASYAGFLRRYAPPASMDAALLDFEYTQKRRIERFVLSGDLSPFRIAPLLAELRSGFEQGRMRPLMLRQSFD